MSEAFDGSGALSGSMAGPEGLMHNWVSWAKYTFALFGILWYTLDKLGVTALVNHSYLPLMFSSIGLGLTVINIVYFYWYQVPNAGKGLNAGQLNPQTAIDNRVVWTDRVFIIVAFILFGVWFSIALTHFIRIDGKGEAAVSYIVTDPEADTNITGEMLVAFDRHRDLSTIGLVFSTIVFVFGSISWGLFTQTMILWQMSQGNLHRGYGGTGEYAMGNMAKSGPLGSGTGLLGSQARGAVRI